MLKPLKTSLMWRWRKGFKGTSKAFYDAAHGAGGDHRAYLPDAAFKALALTNGPLSRAILNDKLLFEKVVAPHAPVPETLALVERGEVFSPLPGGAIGSLEALLAHVQKQAVALKPALGAKGKGVFKLAWDAGLQLDGRPVGADEVAAMLQHLDYYLVVPWLAQAPYAAAVFPAAGNTLRLITMRDPGDGQRPFVAAAVQKFGTRTSAPTDNWSRGALFAPVDVETGVMGAGLEDLAKSGGQPRWHERHSDTGAPIKGLQVPHWDELKAGLLRLLEALPIFTYVGWDVLVTEDGFYIIEGNNAPLVLSLQLTGPTLSDPRVRRFVAHYELRVPGVGRLADA
jgi:hypothetical protein